MHVPCLPFDLPLPGKAPQTRGIVTGGLGHATQLVAGGGGKGSTPPRPPPALGSLFCKHLQEWGGGWTTLLGLGTEGTILTHPPPSW